MEHDQNPTADEYTPHCFTQPRKRDTARHRYLQKVLDLDSRVLRSRLRKFTRNELSTADPGRDVETIVAGEEVAMHMGTAESTVKKQLQVAATRCQHALERRASTPGLLLLSKLLGR